MTSPSGNPKLAKQAVVAGLALGVVYYVGTRFVFKPAQTIYVPDADQPQVGIVPVPSGPGPSGVYSYQGPSSNPWFSHAITIPVNPAPPVQTPNPGGGTGGNGGQPLPSGDPGDGRQAAVVGNWGMRTGGDEFDYTGPPNPAKWGVYDGDGHNGNGRRVPSAFDVHDGMCTILGKSNGDTGGMAYRLLSARTYRYEWRLRMYATGQGSGDRYHPAVGSWPTAENWPVGGEDDMMETDIPDQTVRTFIHHPNQNSGSEQSEAERNLNPAEWHNYAIERSNTRVRTWIDGELWADFTVEQTNGQVPGPMHPFYQLDWVTKSGTTLAEAKLDAAWFRIYPGP